MIYFKKVSNSNYTQNQVELSIRKASIKRTMPLNMDFSFMNIGTDKYFLAREENKGITFTRIKTSFEKISPKLIWKLPSESHEVFYEVRLSTLSTAIFIAVTLGWFLGLTITFFGNSSFEKFLTVSLIYVVYLALLFKEYKLTISNINKAIKRYVSDDR